MKIVIGTSTPFHLVHLARELSKLGNNILIIGYMPRWKMKNYNLGSAKYKSLFWSLFPLSLLALQRNIPKLQRKVTFFLMPLTDYYIARNIPQCDIFIGLSGVNLYSFKIAKKKWKAITICDRGSSHVEVQVNLIKNKKTNLPQQYIERELQGYNVCDYIMLPSLFAVDTFLSQKISKAKIKMNNYGVNLERFGKVAATNNDNRNGMKRKINALFIGGWSFQKGVDIIAEVLELDSDIIVSHIGTNGGERFPSSLRFREIGHISNVHLKKYYNQFDVLLLPSRQDGFGMVILEALACGLPVIASKNTGAPDVKMNIERSNNVILMDSVTVEGLLKAIDTFRKSNLLNHKGEILTEKDKNFFTWKAYGERYYDILKELL